MVDAEGRFHPAMQHTKATVFPIISVLFQGNPYAREMKSRARTKQTNTHRRERGNDGTAIQVTRATDIQRVATRLESIGCGGLDSNEGVTQRTQG